MNKTLSDRLNVAMRDAGFTQASLAERVGMTQAGIQKLTSGKAKSSRRLLDIALALGVDPEWLANGRENRGARAADQPDQLPDEKEWARVASWDSSTPLECDEVEVPFLRDIDLACGDGSYGDDDFNGFKLRFSKATLRRVGATAESVICFPTTGNSMEPLIQDGATVAINLLDKKIVDGKVYAINQDGWKRLKVLHRVGPTKVIIRSFNKDEYPDEEADLNSVEIIGRMFWSASLW